MPARATASPSATLDRARSELGVIAYREAVPGSWWWKLSSKDATNNATDP